MSAMISTKTFCVWENISIIMLSPLQLIFLVDMCPGFYWDGVNNLLLIIFSVYAFLDF